MEAEFALLPSLRTPNGSQSKHNSRSKTQYQLPNGWQLRNLCLGPPKRPPILRVSQTAVRSSRPTTLQLRGKNRPPYFQSKTKALKEKSWSLQRRLWFMLAMSERTSRRTTCAGRIFCSKRWSTSSSILTQQTQQKTLTSVSNATLIFLNGWWSTFDLRNQW